jgi:hypothetical protein
MPRKKNRRKEIQKAKRAAHSKPKQRVGVIAHTPYGGPGVSLALAAALAFAGPGMADQINDKEAYDE